MKGYLCLATLASLASETLSSPVQRRQTYSHHHGHATGPDVSQPLQSILDNSNGSQAYTYPTDFTQGIIPKGIHSHNDYWRKVPFYSALSVGAISVEADVWLVNDTLYVGHDRLSLTQARTFDALYIQPILSVLERQNPKGQIIPDNDMKYGVFDTDPTQTLYLFVDVKTDGEEAWPHVIEALAPLRQAGYLTRYEGGPNLARSAVTVIGTGNTPLDKVQGVTPRDYFFDANLAELNSTQSGLNSTVSPIASTQFSRYVGQINGTLFSDEQLETVRNQVALARERGIGARYWDTPAWPISKRNAVWRTLEDEGVALLNADDLVAAAGLTGPASW